MSSGLALSFGMSIGTTFNLWNKSSLKFPIVTSLFKSLDVEDIIRILT